MSVVISMYNYGKYIGEALDSILEQTLQNFEVIVVDDASTDDGATIVESYIPKFKGRLTLIKLEINSGGGGTPRNKGLAASSGEYCFFMDADDVFTKTALEKMYTLAKKYDADCVYCEKYFMSSGIGQEFKDNVHIADNSRLQKPPFVDEPTLETNDLAKRVEKAIKVGYWVTPWLRLVSRKLLIENNIKFPSLIGSNDVAWTFEVLFCSKRFLLIPNVCYIRRMHDESVSLRKRTTPQFIHKWMDRTIRSLKDMDDFMAGIEFFRENPVYRYKVINTFMNWDFNQVFKVCDNEKDFDVYNMFREKFGEYLGEHEVLVAGLCTRVVGQRKYWKKRYDDLDKKTKQRIAELEKEIKELKRSD